MAKNTCITLGKHFEAFVSDQLKKGRFASVSEVLRAGLRLLEQEETRLDTLRKMLTEGENSGFEDYNLEGLIDELDSEDH